MALLAQSPLLTASYVHGVSEIPLIGETIGVAFDRTAARFPDREALVVRHQYIRWTWKELTEKVNAFAAGLIALGINPGERIGIWSPNNAEWVIAQFATAKAGLILVNVNPAYRIPELEYALKKVNCRALIMTPGFKTSNYIDMLTKADIPGLEKIILIGGTAGKHMIPFDMVMENGSENERQRLEALAGELQFDDPINIQFTSGTTGAPKAATLTHHNILNNAFFTGLAQKFNEKDRLCIPVPMYHCFGMVLGTLTCAAFGAAMVFPSEGFDAHAVLETVATEKCTALHGVPTMFIAELEEPDFASYDLSSLRTGIMAGAPCPVELMKRVMEEMHLTEITIAYGMTETGPVSFQTSVDDPVDRRVSTVGRVLPHTEIKIIDENNRIVPVGTPGELLTRGYCVMPGYWEDPEKTSKAINASHWIYSGDIASLDADGYCRIVGRLKDMLIRGGENIFPREIEEFLYQHPNVEEAEVIGVPDPKYGEEVCAWIKLRPGATATEEEIRDFCRDKIAHFKIPRYIRFVKEFPMTVTGKVQKFKMRETMIEELGLDQAKSA